MAKFLDCLVRVFELFAEHGERRIAVVRKPLVLVVPNEHFEDIYAIPEATLADVSWRRSGWPKPSGEVRLRRNVLASARRTGRRSGSGSTKHEVVWLWATASH